MKAAAVAVSLLLAACPANPPPVGPMPPTGQNPSTGSTPRGTPLANSDVVGYWSGDWGNLVFREQGGKIFGAYDHDDGTIVGTIVGDQLVGWWCEAPSRKPDMDAGPVEMKFMVNAEGSRVIDGRWRFASEGDAWKDNWDITWSSGQAPEALVNRFADPAAFCVQP